MSPVTLAICAPLFTSSPSFANSSTSVESSRRVNVRANTARPQITPSCLQMRSAVPSLFSGMTALVVTSSPVISSESASFMSSSACSRSVMGLFIFGLLYGIEHYALVAFEQRGHV